MVISKVYGSYCSLLSCARKDRKTELARAVGPLPRSEPGTSSRTTQKQCRLFLRYQRCLVLWLDEDRKTLDYE
jgi:hypothetical protein